MNILFISTGFPERGQPATGYPNYLYRVALSLVQMGHKPIILSAGERNVCWRERGIEIQIVNVKQYSIRKFQTLNYFVNAIHKGYILNREIDTLIKKVPIDIIQFTSLEGIALFYHGNIPSILRLSSYAKIAHPSRQTCSAVRVNVMAFLERISATRCNTIIAPCINTARTFEKDIKRLVKVIESPFINDVERYDTVYFDNYLIGKKYVLFFGTLYLEKGILVIAEILQKFLQENQDYYFAFIGDVDNVNGENIAHILKRNAGRHADRLIILHALPHNQLYPIVSHADFVVLPSLMENLSNACIEAMYFERVVIGTDGASFEQLITHGKSGLLCKIGDSNDLLNKMQMAAAMSNVQKEEMGRDARRRIDQLKPEYVVKKLIRLYQYLIDNNKKRKGHRCESLYLGNRCDG